MFTKEQMSIVKKTKGIQFWVKDSKAYFMTTGYSTYIIIPTDMEDGTYDLDMFKLGKVKLLNDKPEVPVFETENKGSFDSKELLRALPFLSEDESRYFICGINLYYTGEIVATDGRTLYSSCKVNSQNENESTIFHISKKNVSLFKAFLKLSDTVQLYYDDKNTRILEASDGTQWIDYQGKDNFPNWNRVYPDIDELKNTFTLPEKKVLDDMLKTIKLYNKVSMRIHFDFGNGKAFILGNDDFEWEIEKSDGRGAFNIEYILRAYEAGVRKLKYSFENRAFMGYIEDSIDIQKPNHEPVVLVMPCKWE